MQCQCIKLDENQCTRHVTSKGGKYCWQHQKCKKKVIKAKKSKFIPFRQIGGNSTPPKVSSTSPTVGRRLAVKLPSKPSFIRTPSPKKIKDMPQEMLFEMALQMNIRDILNLCNTSKEFAKICKTEYLWSLLLKRDYTDEKIKGKTNRELYKLHKLLEWVNKYKIFKTKNVNNLINLKILYIGGKQLKEIPKELGQLTNLEELYLDNNKLKEIPSELGQLTKLKLLDLNENKLKEIPKELGQLTNLKYLDLDYNQIKSLDELPQEIQNLDAEIILK